ncbi:MAG: phytochelatin synthase family protein [Octadecabacter sp.]|nr:phytochelatin synthase family protein [Octadecabacter sp.]
MRTFTLTVLAATLSTAAFAEDDYAKLGPNAVLMSQAPDYLRQNAAPDFWAFSPFTKPQFTSSACSIASVTAALNGLRGLPAMASETVMSQTDLLELTGSAEWGALSAEGGDGVTFAQLVDFTTQAVSATGLDGYGVTSWQPAGQDATAAVEDLRTALADNESTADNALMIYFNQGVVTGDWDGPHISLIGAYDADADSVLILEVDQEWYTPYWTPVPVLLEAMLKPTSAEHGVLEGETGGLVSVARLQ